MTNHRALPVLAAAALVAVSLACAESSSGPIVSAGDRVNLVSPDAGAKFRQNDPTIGCPAHPTRGHGLRFEFDWEDVAGADRYAIHLKRTGAPYPAIDWSIGESEYKASWCNAFVTDANLNGWVWRVAAIAQGPDSLTKADTLWSEERAYGFLPCRLESGEPCSAPDSTSP